MAQIPFRCNLSAANFPLVSEFMGRSVIIPQYDQNFVKRAKLSGEDSDMDIGIPQIYYGHNIMPTGQGFKSIAFTQIFSAADPAVATFDKIVPIKDPDMTRGWLGICTNGKVYIAKEGDGVWTDISSLVTGWAGGQVTWGVGNGSTYVCFSEFDVYKLDVFNRTMASATLSGLTNSDIVAICDAANYLVATDGVDIYWSSTVDPEDFVPSLSTGAGSGVPNDVKGLILAVIPISNGFAIYTSENIVLGSYSGNARYPWIFKPAAGSKGVSDIRKISYDGDSGINYAWTSGGLLKVAPQGCTQVSPEVSDFLAGRIFEDFNSSTNTLSSQYLATNLLVRLAYIGARYLVISYGKFTYTHALVYDVALKRWGKLKTTHTDCFEVGLNTDGVTLTNTAASPKKTFGFLQSDGSIRLADFDYGDTSAEGVLILGKYQLSRSKLITVQGIDVETVDSSNNNFSLLISTTLDGKTELATTTPTTKETAVKSRRYNARKTGMNHSLIFKGAFNLVSVLMYVTQNGNR